MRHSISIAFSATTVCGMNSIVHCLSLCSRWVAFPAKETVIWTCTYLNIRLAYLLSQLASSRLNLPVKGLEPASFAAALTNASQVSPKDSSKKHLWHDMALHPALCSCPSAKFLAIITVQYGACSKMQSTFCFPHLLLASLDSRVSMT